MPPGASKDANMRYLDIHEGDKIDEAQLTKWVKQAAKIPGWMAKVASAGTILTAMCSQRMAREKKKQPDGDGERVREVINRELAGQPRQQQGLFEKEKTMAKGTQRSTPHGRPRDA